MNGFQHTVLCVDDEIKILHSLRRLLRGEGYRLLTATSGFDGLKILKENDVHLVMSDQRMPGMSGTEFLNRVKNEYPHVIRIILTVHTDVDFITESINKGHIFKFFLKPWNDQDLKFGIKQALKKYDLVQANKKLQAKILEQNEELKRINENLKGLVKERTWDLEIQNQALELSRAVLEDLPLKIIGVSAQGTIWFTNREAQSLSINSKGIEVGKKVRDYFSSEVEEKLAAVFTTNTRQKLKAYRLSEVNYDIFFVPLPEDFAAKELI